MRRIGFIFFVLSATCFGAIDVYVEGGFCVKQSLHVERYSTSNSSTDDVINNTIQREVDKRSLKIEQMHNRTKLMKDRINQEKNKAEENFNNLNKRLVSLAVQVKGLNILSNEEESELPRLDFIHKGYRYVLTRDADSWQNSRRTCQSFGGDLAFVGIKDFSSRQNIAGFLEIVHAWIGLNDIKTENDWKWVDNSKAKEGIHWNQNEPNGVSTRDEDCALIWKIATTQWLTFDASCNAAYLGLCEIKL